MDTNPPQGSIPAHRTNLTLNEGAARLAPFGSQPAAPRPEARNAAQAMPPQRQITSGQPNDLDTVSATQETPDTEGVVDPAQQDDATGQEPERELAPDTVLWQTDDGQDVTVEEARRGYLRQQDYTRKLQWVTQGRNTIETTLQDLHTDRQAVAGLIMQALPDLSPEKLAGMDGATVARLASQRDQMLQFVHQLRQQSVQERQRTAEMEYQQASALMPEIRPQWLDPQVQQQEQQLAKKYLDKLGVPPQTRDLIGRNPWLVNILIEAALHEGVKIGGERGRQTQQQLRRQLNPSLPSSNQASPGRTQSSPTRDGLVNQIRTARSTRVRMNAGAQLLAPFQGQR